MAESTNAIVVPGVADDISFENYSDERQLRDIADLVAGELSEPYSTFTYRYFLVQWPKLCICVYQTSEKKKILIGAIICKVDEEGVHRDAGC